LNLLIFEYATASGFNDPSLLAEGQAMLEGLLEDFQDFKIHYLISEKFLTQEYLEKWKSAQPIILKEGLRQWITKNISAYDGCLFIAAEEDMELYELTCIMEDKGVQVYGSTSQAVLNCSDKFKTYSILKNHFPVINTYKLILEDFKCPENQEKYALLVKDKKMVLKPADGVACQGINIVYSFEDLKNAVESLNTFLPYALLQDFVEGESCSVSLLSTGDKAIPLTLNRQKIEFIGNGMEYQGAEVPWEHELSKEALEVAKKAVESVDGLKGYVGIDLILNNQVHILEINSRLTTPFVAIRKISSVNMGHAIIDAVKGILPEDLNCKGKILLEKSGHNLIIKNQN